MDEIHDMEHLKNVRTSEDKARAVSEAAFAEEKLHEEQDTQAFQAEIRPLLEQFLKRVEALGFPPSEHSIWHDRRMHSGPHLVIGNPKKNPYERYPHKPSQLALYKIITTYSDHPGGGGGSYRVLAIPSDIGRNALVAALNAELESLAKTPPPSAKELKRRKRDVKKANSCLYSVFVLILPIALIVWVSIR